MKLYFYAYLFASDKWFNYKQKILYLQIVGAEIWFLRDRKILN